MPVTVPGIIPKQQKELNDKINATIPGVEEYIILADVQSHLGRRGHAVYQQTQQDIADVHLTATKCIIFLIGGKFKVGEKLVTGLGEGYLVENEKTIQLQTYTVVVIIDQD